MNHYPGQHKEKLILNDLNQVKLQSFNLSDIRLLESPFKQNMLRESDWMMSFPINRLLHSFRTNAGIYSEYEGGHYAIEPLGGWESQDSDLRGHAIGHLLSGLALLYASTGDEAYKDRGDRLVEGLAEVQQALGESGYLSAFPENLINRNIRGQEVWAPWYTLHKLFAGLMDLYLFCNNETALKVVKGMASWAYNKLKSLSEDTRKLMLQNEFGGVNESFYSLYAITGNEQHKWLAEFFYHNEVLDPLLEEKDILNKKHANTYIPKLIGLVRGYELGGPDDYLKIVDFFWKTVVHDHSFATGNNEDKEKFFKANEHSKHLSGYTGETCDIYNMLKLTHHLHSIHPSREYADFYERALYNVILGQQDPQSGMVTYFLPFLPGAHKVYSTYDQSFWCCVGTGFESHSKYGEFIYSYTDQDLYVNLFIPSELNWKEKGLKMIQQCDFPNENKTTLALRLESPQELNVKLRCPSWATSVSVKINGEETKVGGRSDEYILLSRQWANGDLVELEFGMELKAVPTPDDPNIIAFMYGPMVLAGRLGTEGMEAPAPYSDPSVRNDYYTYDFKLPEWLSNEIQLDLNELSNEIDRLPGDQLNFRLKSKNIILSPISEVHRERYIIYWKNKP